LAQRSALADNTPAGGTRRCRNFARTIGEDPGNVARHAGSDHQEPPDSTAADLTWRELVQKLPGIVAISMPARLPIFPFLAIFAICVE
jgi:hypothetical protein